MIKSNKFRYSLYCFSPCQTSTVGNELKFDVARGRLEGLIAVFYPDVTDIFLGLKVGQTGENQFEIHI